MGSDELDERKIKPLTPFEKVVRAIAGVPKAEADEVERRMKREPPVPSKPKRKSA